MTRQLNIAGRNSNEVYTLFYPNNLINFCKYDFSVFMEHCTDLCRLAARSGEYSVEDMYSIRNSISGCHKYYEQNMHTIFEKIVIDCWIDYLCKQNDIGTGALWQGFMRCRNDFERAIFNRLSDYRYNRAINEWTNLTRMQDYARTKTDFVYGLTLSGPQEAAARANYFDLMFNVAANEQGFPLGEIASTNVFSMGRLPNSPFIMSNAAREIARNQLSDLPYIEGGYKSKKNPDLTDKMAMDAFAAVKNYIPSKNDTMAKTIIRSITGSPQNIYMPCSFKAVIDLEIDMITESGAVIQKCAGCGEYFLKDENYNYDYCDRQRKDGLTCLEFAEKNNEVLVSSDPAAFISTARDALPDDDDFSVIYVDKSVLTEKTDALYKEMAARVNVDMTQRDFSNWYQKELRLKEQVILGEAGEKELDEFIELSRGDHFATKRQNEAPRIEPPASENDSGEPELTEDGKAVKKFVFERVERGDNVSPAPAKTPEPKAPAKPAAQSLTLNQSEQATMDAIKRLFAEKNPQASPTPQAVQAPVMPQQMPVQQYGYGPAPYGYGGYAQPYQQPAYPAYPYGQPYQAAPQRPVSRVIRGGTPAAQDYIPKQKTVVIPNDIQPKPRPEQPKPPERVFVPEPDVKVFLPKSSDGGKSIENIEAIENTENIEEISSVFRTKQTGGYIEPSPYERMKEDYIRGSQEEEPPQDENLEGQISIDEIDAIPKTPAASVISAYRTAGVEQPDDRSGSQPEKADFSRVLDGIKRDDGFARDDEAVDADGLPLSHKTKHVMNALFGPAKRSPVLRASLDDDDD